MHRSLFVPKFLIVMAVIAIIILYGSLYPFLFRVPENDIGALNALLRTWAQRPGRGDFVANVLLYLPLGFFCVLAISEDRRSARRIAFALCLGAALSICVELTQYYDKGRIILASDIYSNVLGTILGAVAGSAISSQLRLPLLAPMSANRVPALLLAAWAGYRLYPYVPVIDLHKYWDALKPVILNPSLAPYDLFRHTAIGLSLCCLIEALYGRKYSSLMFLMFAGSLLAAKIVIINGRLSVAEVAGAGLAFIVWLALTPAAGRARTATIALILGVYVVALRLEPFEFRSEAGSFDWVPFLSFMRGSIGINAMSFLEKFYLYGALIWLLGACGFRLRVSTIFVASLLFLTSWAEIYLPLRSAGITDAVMALVIGGIIALMRTDKAEDDRRYPSSAQVRIR